MLCKHVRCACTYLCVRVRAHAMHPPFPRVEQTFQIILGIMWSEVVGPGPKWPRELPHPPRQQGGGNSTNCNVPIPTLFQFGKQDTSIEDMRKSL